MMMIQPTSFVPIYEQIKTEIKSRISLGVLRPHEPLPSIRDLAGELLVNPNTVARAYRDLEQAGFIYTRKGKACFVAEDSASLIRKANQSLLEEIFESAIEEAAKFGFSAEEIREAFEERFKAGGSRTRGEGR
jgi:GntR family transcriptional regulator